MITWFRVDTMGTDGKWHCVTSGIGMTPHMYDKFELAFDDARTASNDELVQTRVVKITEDEFIVLTPNKPLSRDYCDCAKVTEKMIIGTSPICPACFKPRKAR